MNYLQFFLIFPLLILLMLRDLFKMIYRGLRQLVSNRTLIMTVGLVIAGWGANILIVELWFSDVFSLINLFVGVVISCLGYVMITYPIYKEMVSQNEV